MTTTLSIESSTTSTRNDFAEVSAPYFPATSGRFCLRSERALVAKRSLRSMTWIIGHVWAVTKFFYLPIDHLPLTIAASKTI